MVGSWGAGGAGVGGETRLQDGILFEFVVEGDTILSYRVLINVELMAVGHLYL